MAAVLFICVHNSGRSQMAEAFFNVYAPSRLRASSAGSEPGEDLNPVAVQAMKELGIDMSGQRPKAVTLEMMERADRVVSMGCGVEESCPAALVPVEDWQLDDPHGQPIEKVREIRDRIQARVRDLIREMGA